MNTKCDTLQILVILKKKKKKEFIRGTQICTMVLKYLPVKLSSSPIKGK